MRIILTALLLASTVLAGCADDAPAAPDDDPFQPVEVPEDKGIIRGLVVDATIVPLEGAIVRIEGSDNQVRSDAGGLFLFEDLEPGTYFLSVKKLGYVSAQASADVVAGEARPPIVKVQLAADPSSLPSVEYHQFDGFMQCSFALVAVGFNACGLVADVSEQDLGETQVRYDVRDVPMWIQTEMVWQSSQPLGDSLALLYSYGDCGSGFYCDHEVEGPSVLVLTANETVARTMIEEEGQIYIRVFGTETSSAPGSGAGATMEQEFTHFTSVFYGFKPDDGWLFTRDGPHPLPT